MQIIISLYRRDMWPVRLQLMIIFNIDSPVDCYIWLEIYSTESLKNEKCKLKVTCWNAFHSISNVIQRWEPIWQPINWLSIPGLDALY